MEPDVFRYVHIWISLCPCLSDLGWLHLTECWGTCPAHASMLGKHPKRRWPLLLLLRLLALWPRSKAAFTFPFPWALTVASLSADCSAEGSVTMVLYCLQPPAMARPIHRAMVRVEVTSGQRECGMHGKGLPGGSWSCCCCCCYLTLG